uniref:C-type lectin domain-containing protein n=1 Tax=Glossina palpalis gambiensis TaxID=67801 RepID=A0A1B0BGP9_9MUSC
MKKPPGGDRTSTQEAEVSLGYLTTIKCDNQSEQRNSAKTETVVISKSEIVVKPVNDISTVFNYEPYEHVGQKLLYFSEEEVSWFKANDICRKMHRHLTFLDNKTDMKAIDDYLKANVPGDLW